MVVIPNASEFSTMLSEVCWNITRTSNLYLYVGCNYLRLKFVSLFQLTSRDSELDSIKDRYNAALKDVGATLGFCLCWFYRLDLLVVVVFYQYVHAPSEEHCI